MRVVNRTKIVFLVVLIALLIVGGISFYFYDNRSMEAITQNIQGDSLSFSVDAGIYENDVNVIIAKGESVPFYANIYYTTDGSEPTEASQLYQGELSFPCGEQDQVIPLRAALIYQGESSDVYTRVYVIGKNAISHYSNLPTVYINGNDEELWSYENGILIAGKDFDDYVKEQRALGIKEEINLSPDVPANFNRDVSCAINFSVFDETGVCVVNQGAGLSIRGNVSRTQEQKSFKIKADDDFTYNFWNQDSEQGSKLTKRNKYRVINLSSGGQDNLQTLVRDQVISVIARKCGFSDYVGARPAVVYINGSFYGTAVLKEDYTDGYLSDLYSVPSEDIDIFKGDEDAMLSYLGYPPEQVLDFTDEQFRTEFEQKVDMDQLLSYYAFEMMCDNCDWPYNNIEVWRYKGDQRKEGTMMDGRARFLIYDMDQSFKLDADSYDAFDLLLYNDPPAENIDLLYQLMKYPPYKERFVNHVCDFLSLTFNKEDLTEIVKQSNAVWGNNFEMEKELTGFQTKREMLNQRDEKLSYLLSQTEKREDEVKNFLFRYFNADDAYYIRTIAPEKGTIIHVSRVPVYETTNDSKIMRAFGTATQITPSIANGKCFAYWLVNGEKRDTEILEVDEKDSLGEDHTITIELVTKERSQDGLMINEVSEAGDDDWVELYNGGNQSVFLGEYYLSDDKKELSKFHCPEVRLKPGEVIWLNGKSNPQLNEYIMNFNLKDGETLLLYHDKTKQVKDSVTIPDMFDGESYGRYLETNEYRFYQNPSPKECN